MPHFVFPHPFERQNISLRKRNRWFQPYLKTMAKQVHPTKTCSSFLRSPNCKAENPHRLKMSLPPELRECSWTDNSDTSRSSDEENDPRNNFGIFPTPTWDHVLERAPSYLLRRKNSKVLDYFGNIASLTHSWTSDALRWEPCRDSSIEHGTWEIKWQLSAEKETIMTSTSITKMTFTLCGSMDLGPSKEPFWSWTYGVQTPP